MISTLATSTKKMPLLLNFLPLSQASLEDIKKIAATRVPGVWKFSEKNGGQSLHVRPQWNSLEKLINVVELIKLERFGIGFDGNKGRKSSQGLWL